MKANATRVPDLLAKFPSLVHEDNNFGEDSHQHDLCCPECGDRDAISIEGKSWFEIYHDGTGEHEDIEWDNDSGCKCRSCDHVAKLRDFTFEGLDDAIDSALEGPQK
jgi:hypothetical protein